MNRAGLASVLALVFAIRAISQAPTTVAESSDYKATSRHGDVVAFCEQLAKVAPQTVRLSDMGFSGEKRRMPLIIVAEPPVSSPEEANASGKLVVFAQANIHAGEVDGKEALLMLARDLALAKDRPLLKDLIFVVAPNVNPDGNDRLSNKNRTEQNGPAEVGTRANAAGLDLNRDFVKLESPEGQAMVRVYRRWNPAVVIDMHTTNGSYHQFVLTYDGPRHPAISDRLVSFVRDALLPDVGKRVLKKTGYPSMFYGFMNRDRTRWESYPAQLRYGTQYVGLRGRIAVLSESYTYAPFKDRIIAGREFVRSILDYLVENKDAVRKVLDEAAKPAERIAVAHKLSARSVPVTILGYVETNGKPDLKQPKEYKVELVDRAEPTAYVTRPTAYLVPPTLNQAIETLQRHGIELLELREDIELPVDAATIQKIIHQDRPFQGHPITTLEVGPIKSARKRFSAGTLLVRTSQPLGRLASILLETASEDGLVTWNQLDGALKVDGEFPVYRLMSDVPLTAGPARRPADERVTGKRIQPGHLIDGLPLPNFSGSPVRGIQWLKDGEHFLQQKQLKLLKVHAASGRVEPFVDAAKLAKAIADGLKIAANRAQQIATGGANLANPFQPGYLMNPQQTGFVFRDRDDLCFAVFDGSKVTRLTHSPGAKELVTFSPDGNWIAFIRDLNLFTVDLATQTERKLTTDGGGKIFNGKADWVYYEEVFDRDHRAYWWSPNSSALAFIRYDDTPVSPFPVVDHLPTLAKLEQTPYPKAGHPNPLAKLGVVAAAGGPTHFVATPNYKPEETLLLRAAWQLDGREVLFYLTDRAQTWLDVMSVRLSEKDSAPAGEARRLIHETTKAWVNDPGDPIFLKDGRFLMYSERDGWKHVYLHNRDGQLLRRVTEGPWEVTRVHLVEEKTGQVYFTGTIESSTAQNLYRVALDGNSPPVALTRGGDRRINLSPTGSYFIDSSSSHTSPPVVSLCRLDGAIERRIDTNPVYALGEYKLGKFESVKIPLKDGFVLEGSILYPVEFDPAKQYPVWFMTYGGPHSPTIHDAWEFRTFDHVLSSLGIIVFRCDPRSASGKGAVSTWTAYKQLGVQELKDVEGAIDWLLANHSFVDAKHIGMSGSSYGGFLTAYCLTHSKKFAAGIAGAPVTDWHLYDSIYTERYMDVPEKNRKGYAETSVVGAARNLHGRLLVMHGLMDDNVHVQNSVKLMEELERAGKEFEVMFYPQARHGFGGAYSRHYQRTMLEFIRRTMGK